MADADDVVTVERVIPAPPEEIFELLADPRRHRMIDGSDSVRDPENAPGFRFMVKPAAKRTRAAMAATLERIEHLVTQP